MTSANRPLIRNLVSCPVALLCHLLTIILLLAMGAGAKAENEVLYGYSAQGFCANTYDTVQLAITIKVDASTPDGIYQIRYNRINQAGPDSYDPFCNFWVSNGIITAAEWPGTGIGTSAFTFGGGIDAGIAGGGLRYYDYSNYDHKVEWPVSEGGSIDVGPCPAPPGIVYTGAMTLDFGGGGTVAPEDHTKETDTKRGGSECEEAGMASYSAHARVASLNIQDTPIGYIPARGPAAKFTVRYNQRENQQPQTFGYSNLGPKWNFSWLAYITVNPNNPSANVALHAASGGVEVYGGFDAGSQTYTLPDAQSHALLAKTGPDTYERRLPDGSKQIFSRVQTISSSVRNVFMTQIVDAAGNAATIAYDTSFRVTSFTDALGYATTLSYELPGDPLKITKVTEPFPTGRTATFTYTNGQLTTITDVIGIQSQFHYTPGTDFIDSLTTPYGTSTFATGESGTTRWIEMTDPEGGLERIEYRDHAPGIGATEPDGAPWPIPSSANANLDVANSFYWNKKTTQMYPPVNGVYDYTKAEILHWVTDAKGIVTGIIASKKEPLEWRVWHDYAYANVASPSTVSRWLPPDVYYSTNTLQVWRYEYNAIGKKTKSTDPRGRQTTYIYAANNVDLLEVRQTNGGNDLLRKFTYNAQHLPLTETDAAGQVTTFTYNAQGQLLTRKNARNETTTYAYGGTVPAGYLASITGPPFNSVSAVTRFTYDSANRVRTVTDPDNYTVTTDYDNLDRKTNVAYPDGTFEQFQYTDYVSGAMSLDLTGSRDRRGLWTYRHYNGNRQLDSITDPANRTTIYGWCTCGLLTSITDPKNQTTNFHHDTQSRLYQKVFQDGTTIDYLYEGQTAPNTVGLTSRLKSSTDAKGQRTTYLYEADDNVTEIVYTDTAGEPLVPHTPKVVFTYDYRYNRVSSMTDASGPTAYAYNAITVPPVAGASQLASIDGPLANDTITLSYDQLGRVTTRSINGTANSETWTFDSLGRVTNNTNKLGTFTNTYVGVTDRLSKTTYPGGSANYTYFPNAQDKRLQQIKNLTSKNALISQFDYTYDVHGEIQTWTKNYAGLATPQRYELGHDNADQLTTAPLKNASTNALIKQYTYGYDAASNRTSELAGSVTTTSTPNNVNEIISQSGGMNRSLSYDFNGNMTSDGGTRTFEWDAANHLVAINYTGQTTRSEFTYDGLNRVVKIVEKTGNTINSTLKFVWHGDDKCEVRDAADAVTLRLYAKGQFSGTKAYLYTRDHLGSIREMLGTTGTVVARYDYDPFGRSTTVLGTTPTDINFTGLYRHSKSNLLLAINRAYDPDLGRWLSRDPLKDAELSQGPNLYAYVKNDPTRWTDPTGEGLWTFIKCARIIQKWQKNCFSKLPDCRTACGKTAEDQLAALAACMQDHADKSSRCLEGMNRELVEAKCATMSVGKPPGG